MDYKIINQIIKELSKINLLDDLGDARKKYLGKDGNIKLMLREIVKMSQKEKVTQGQLIQKVYKEATALFEQKEKVLRQKEKEKNLRQQAEDLGYKLPKTGHLHPITQTIRILNKIFTDMGYSIVDGPEIETDKYCFQRLNIPIDHPAKDMQDTLYIQEPNFLLRTHTSSIEARVLEAHKPPLKVVCPGRVYRNEKPNKSNHFIFHHYQGFLVMKKVNLKDLFGTIDYLFRKMYGSDVKIRFRNKYYPEVEPGVGPDMQCFNCKGKGCAVCKDIGWIEMGGAGIIHPNIMSVAGIDNKKWMGFAFGLGIDRWVMAKYNITDIRTLLGGNLVYKYYENESTI